MIETLVTAGVFALVGYVVGFGRGYGHGTADGFEDGLAQARDDDEREWQWRRSR